MLSHRPYLAPKEGDVIYIQQCDTILKLKNLWLKALLVTLENKTIFQHICEDIINAYLVAIVKSHQKNPFSNFDKFKFHDGLLYHDVLLYIPEGLTQLQVLQAKQKTLVVSYFAFNKTMELVSYDYWWLQLWKFVKEFVSSCDVCVRAKNLRHHPHELLQPLLVPILPSSPISMDFIMDLL